MVRHASLFSQLVALFNRGQFLDLVFRHKAECYCKVKGTDIFYSFLVINKSVPIFPEPASAGFAAVRPLRSKYPRKDI